MNQIRCVVGETIEINFCRAYNKIMPKSLSLPKVRTNCVYSKCHAKTNESTGIPIDFMHLIPELDVPEEEVLSDKEIMIRCQCSNCQSIFAKSIFSFFDNKDEKKAYYDKHGLEYKEEKQGFSIGK